MANMKIIDLPTGSPESTSFFEATQVDEQAESGRASVKLALNAFGNFVAGQGASPLEYGNLETESTTLIGAANELHNTIGADAYDDTATYNTGDYCIHNGGLYKCNTAITTPEAWTPAHWTATTVADAINEVNLELSDTVSNIEYLRSRCYLGNYSTFVVTLPDVRQGGTGFNHKLIVVGYNAFAILNCDYSGATVSVVSLGSNAITATKLANSFDVTVNLNDTSWGGIRVITLD